MATSRWAFLAWGLVLGAVLGLNFAGVWPQVPVHAVSTDNQDNVAIATGPMDDEVEAVVVLDSLTGDLKAAALSLQTGRFNSLFEYNVSKDFKGSKNPKYAMVTGIADLRRQAGQGNSHPARCVIYVAEVSSGQMGAYSVIWNPAMQQAGQMQRGPIVPLDVFKFRNVAVRNANTP